ncbi:MAG TPA: alpha/beta fold hydrolase [Phenylobacterium sp.]|jgi:alpha-beta hydrolase superfamily lysophospholipase|uniref:alpha/beta fold hydrolase n=1 Tax=Phenylobacterium sp. TaxID=1871053 RepID=UPI002D3F5E41|nr:alpha/beta fold hydrolase [Phenylobacterium sp.]HZZ67366.1 alpha/beta fold hydrolase [Phenylobacterium sp.]
MAIRERTFRFAGAEGADIAGFRWTDDTVTPRAILQVAHGMGEHAGRYRAPLTPLIAAGWAVYADDHRGHGLTAGGPEALGDFGKNGAELIVEDLRRLTSLARAEHPDLPLILLGHSLGSFFAQAFVFDHSRAIDGLVLSGTAAFGDRTDAPRRLDEVRMDGEPPRTPFDWLSRDPAQVDAYIADPLCGFSRKPGGDSGFGRLAARVRDPAEVAKIRKDLPIYIFVGDKDPINQGLALLKPLVERYRETGLTDLDVKVYPGGRHEMLNETNRAEVIADLTRWLERVAG